MFSLEWDNRKYTAPPLKYSCLKKEPKFNKVTRSTNQFTGNMRDRKTC